jgi:hypothetical protein
LSTPGATEIADAPLSPEAAAARRRELMQGDYGKAAAAGDMTKIAELTKLWRVEHGMTPEPVPPATPEDVRASMLDRDLQLDDMRLCTWERLADMDDQQKFEHRRGLATAQQVADARDAIERMKKDAGFRVRVLNGDQDAVRKWLLAGRVATMQIADADHDWSK